jgi:hypothetical protein
MLKTVSLLILMSVIAFSLACQTATAPSNSSTNASSNSGANVANSNISIPAEFSTKPANVDPANLPAGITNGKSNISNTISNGPIAPGIDPKAAMKPNVKGTPPIPGIPSEAEIKKQMANTKIDPNAVNGKVTPPKAANVQSNEAPSKPLQTGKPKQIQ